MDEQERRHLAPRRGRRFHLALAAAGAAVWAPVEAACAWLTAVAVAAPFQDVPVLPGLPQDLSSVHTATFSGALTVACTAAGLGILRRARHAGRPEVVVLDHRGIRTDRLHGDDARLVADIPWDEVRAVARDAGQVVVHGVRGRTVIATAGDAEQQEALARAVDARLDLRRGDDRPPVLPGWQAYPDDRGATLARVHDTWRADAAAAAAGSLLCGVNGVALAVDPPGLRDVWAGADGGLVVLLGFGAIGLALAAYDHAVRRPRWVARPGAVVLEARGPGRGVTFEARSLELRRTPGEPRPYSLLAVAADGAAEREVMSRDRVPDHLAAAGEWLARHADIPFRTTAEHQAR